MNTQRVQQLLLAEALIRRDIGPEARPTPECPPMQTLADVAAGRCGGSADQRKHIYSCDFCLAMIDKMQPKRVIPVWLFKRVGYPSSLAACLVAGVLLGIFVPSETGPAQRGMVNTDRLALLDADDRLAGLVNDFKIPELRGARETARETSNEALREENNRLRNIIESGASAIDEVRNVLKPVLEQLAEADTTGTKPPREP